MNRAALLMLSLALPLGASAHAQDPQDRWRSFDVSRQLHDTLPWYGLWAVSNEWKDVSDLASIKEQRSYVVLERPDGTVVAASDPRKGGAALVQ